MLNIGKHLFVRSFVRSFDWIVDSFVCLICLHSIHQIKNPPIITIDAIDGNKVICMSLLPSIKRTCRDTYVDFAAAVD